MLKSVSSVEQKRTFEECSGIFFPCYHNSFKSSKVSWKIIPSTCAKCILYELFWMNRFVWGRNQHLSCYSWIIFPALWNWISFWINYLIIHYSVLWTRSVDSLIRSDSKEQLVELRIGESIGLFFSEQFCLNCLLLCSF